MLQLTINTNQLANRPKLLIIERIQVEVTIYIVTDDLRTVGIS